MRHIPGYSLMVSLPISYMICAGFDISIWWGVLIILIPVCLPIGIVEIKEWLEEKHERRYRI